MKKEAITTKQMIFLIMLFIFGNTAMVGFRTNVAQDTWISILAAIVLALPMMLIFARIINLYPGKNLFDIMQEIFKPIIGKILIVLMIWYALFIGSNIICIFNNFIRMTSLIGTPRLIISITFIAVSTYLAISKIDGLGKGTATVFYLTMATFVVTLLLSAGKITDFKNLYPIANHSIGQIADGAWSVYAMPIGEVFLFIGLADAIKRKKNDNISKVFIYALLIAMGILLLVFLRNLLLIGANLMQASYFSSYRTARVVGIANVLERIEGLLTYSFMMGGIAKLTVCMIFAAKGTTKLFGLKKYKTLIAPISLLILSFCIIGNDNIIEIFDFLKIYKYYALPFQVVIPLIVWIGAEIKTRSDKTSSANTESVPEP